MRDELKTVFYTASPHINSDQYSAKEIEGYGAYSVNRGLCVETEEREVMDQFGYRPNFSYNIVMSGDDAANFNASINDGLWFTQPTKTGLYYQDPPYIIESVRRFANVVSVDARKTV